MRMTILIAAIVVMGACTSGRDRGSQRLGVSTSKAVNTVEFREQCKMFESLDFGQKSAATLGGRTWVSTNGGTESLPGVQIAARELSSGKVAYAIASVEGRYALPTLRSGEYEVWTCFDGFDELRFRLTLDPTSSAPGIDLYLGASEAPGRRDVVLAQDE
jgi:hypothetical protein